MPLKPKLNARSFGSFLVEYLAQINWLTYLIIFSVIGIMYLIAMSQTLTASVQLHALLSSPVFWILIAVIPILEAAVHAAYWYFRTRNPRYIEKQEAYERWQEERTRKKKAESSAPSSSNDTKEH